jgi:hypothetical protein
MSMGSVTGSSITEDSVSNDSFMMVPFERHGLGTDPAAHEARGCKPREACAESVWLSSKYANILLDRLASC